MTEVCSGVNLHGFWKRVDFGGFWNKINRRKNHGQFASGLPAIARAGIKRISFHQILVMKLRAGPQE